MKKLCLSIIIVLYIIIIIFLFSAPIVDAATYYVKNGGNNSLDGSSDGNAWETVAKVNSVNFASGDIIQFKRGDTFADATLTLSGVGGSKSGITVQDYGSGNKPFFNGDFKQPIYISNRSISNLTIKNIDISGQDWQTIKDYNLSIYGISGIVLDGIDGNGAYGGNGGSQVGKSAVGLVDVSGTVEIKNCTLYNWGPTPILSGSTDLMAIVIQQMNSGTYSIHDNIIHDVAADLLHLYISSATGTVYNNTLYNGGENAIDDKGADNLTIYSNTIYREAGFTGSGGSGTDPAAIVVGHYGGSVTENVVIRNNTFSGGDWDGVHVFNCDGVDIYENTFDCVEIAFYLGGATSDVDFYENTIICTSEQCPNLVTNGDFSEGKPPWAFYTNGSGNYSVVGGEAKVAINTQGTNVQLSQTAVVVEGDTQYRLTFRARHTTGRDVMVSLIKHAAPYTSRGLTQTFNLTKSMKTFSIEFTTPPGGMEGARLMFYMAPYDQNGTTYFFDDVVLAKADCHLSTCGDGNVDPDEECDEGDGNSEDPDASCRTDCTLAGCGDGVHDSDEECDDHNTTPGDGCDENCELEIASITPTPISPADDATIDDLTPTFEWSTFKDGGDGETQAGYQVRVHCDDDNNVIVYDTGFVDDTSSYTHQYSPGTYTGTDPVTGHQMVSDPLKWGKHYHWHVRYRDSGGDWSAWSANNNPDPHQDFYTYDSVQCPNLLTNGDFSGGKPPWTFHTNGSGNYSVVGGEARVVINTQGTNVQLSQAPLVVEGDTQYRLTFRARHTTGRDVMVRLIKHAAPYTSCGLKQTFNLTTLMKTFSIEFTTPPGGMEDARLMFYMAPYDQNGTTYFFDDVVLEALTCGGG